MLPIIIPAAIAVVGLVIALRSMHAPVKIHTPRTATEASQTIFVVRKGSAPRVSAAQLTQAKTIAAELESRLLANTYGPNYITGDVALKQVVAEFQRVLGLHPDGLYGPRTSGALMAMTSRPPPPPFFYPENRIVVEYRS